MSVKPLRVRSIGQSPEWGGDFVEAAVNGVPLDTQINGNCLATTVAPIKSVD